MQTYIEQIGDTLRRASGIAEVQFNSSELVVTVNVGQGRKQTVRMTCHSSDFGQYATLRLQSRAFVPRTAQDVRRALELNNGNQCWGLALDTSVKPPVVDLLYGMICQGSEMTDILAALTLVATNADHLEKSVGGSDRF